MTSPHLVRVAPGLAPGSLYSRIVTDTDQVLTDHALAEFCVLQQAAADSDRAWAWLDEHPTGRVYLYIYDGDDGECVRTVIMDGVHRDD